MYKCIGLWSKYPIKAKVYRNVESFGAKSIPVYATLVKNDYNSDILKGMGPKKAKQ